MIGKVVKRRPKKNKDAAEFTKYFNQLIGLEDVPSDQIVYKFDGMMYECNTFIGVWKIFINDKMVSQIIKHDFPGVISDIEEFVKASEKTLAELTLPEKGASETKIFSGSLQDDLLRMTGKYDNKALNTAYRALKKSKLVESIIVTYERLTSALTEHKTQSGADKHCLDFSKAESCSSDFIKNKDLDAKYLGFSGLDFQHLYERYPEQEKYLDKLVLLCLQLSHEKGSKIYEYYMTPDINIDNFATSFLERIKDLKKIVKDCDEAFALISKSVTLLQTNFPKYYESFMNSKQQPGIIFESFLVDVAASAGNSLSIKSQIAKIITQVKNKMMQEGKLTKEAVSLAGYAETLLGSLPSDK